MIKRSITDKVLRVNTVWDRVKLSDYDLDGAACANPDYDPEWWTIDRTSRVHQAMVNTNNKIAKRICMTCGIRQQCLQTAIENPELLGVWGGTTDSERLEMRTASYKYRSRRTDDRSEGRAYHN